MEMEKCHPHTLLIGMDQAEELQEVAIMDLVVTMGTEVTMGQADELLTDAIIIIIIDQAAGLPVDVTMMATMDMVGTMDQEGELLTDAIIMGQVAGPLESITVITQVVALHVVVTMVREVVLLKVKSPKVGINYMCNEINVMSHYLGTANKRHVLECTKR